MIKTTLKPITSIFLVCLIICASNIKAEPWVDTSDLILRADIQLLSDLQLLSAPTTTYPLMWASLDKDIAEIKVENVPQFAMSAYVNVNYHLKIAMDERSEMKLNASNKGSRFTSFGDDNRENSMLSLNSSAVGNNWAAKIDYQYAADPIDSNFHRFDGSYVALKYDNWLVSAGSQDRWWGPGWDTSMALTNNARPIPAISVSRNTSEPFEIPFFNEIKIPWTLTTFMGEMEKQRVVPNTLLWGFRMTAKPIKNLELGITRLAQWGGDGRPKDSSTFVDLFLGRDNCGTLPGQDNCNINTEPGNQMAGWDARWTSIIASRPFSFYLQGLAEDGSALANSFLTEVRYMAGVDTQLSLFDQHFRMFLEASDTFADCTDKDAFNIGNCYYEHHIYRTGMRFKNRVLGNIYENDSRNYVIGLISQRSQYSSWQIKLRYLQLNQDNSDISPGNPFTGNTLTEIAENLTMLSAKYSWQLNSWTYQLSGQISRSSFIDNSSSSDVNLFLKAVYRF